MKNSTVILFVLCHILLLCLACNKPVSDVNDTVHETQSSAAFDENDFALPTMPDNKEIVFLEIIVNESRLEYIPEFPEATYLAYVRVTYSDSSYETPSRFHVQWSSSDESVLILDLANGGGVRPTGPGTATITAEYNGFNAEKTVTIKEGSITDIVFHADLDLYFLNSEPTDRLLDKIIPVYAVASNGMLFEVKNRPINYEWKITDTITSNEHVTPKQDGYITIRQQRVLKQGGDSSVIHHRILGQDESITEEHYMLEPGETITLIARWNEFSVNVDVMIIDVNDFKLESSDDEITLFRNEACKIKIFAISDQCKANVTNDVSWRVEDESVLEVINGSIFAGKEGRTKIIADFENQSISIPVEVN